MDIENVWQQSSGSDDALNKMLQQKDLVTFSQNCRLVN
jgi:hypothetical protein